MIYIQFSIKPPANSVHKKTIQRNCNVSSFLKAKFLHVNYSTKHHVALGFQFDAINFKNCILFFNCEKCYEKFFLTSISIMNVKNLRKFQSYSNGFVCNDIFTHSRSTDNQHNLKLYTIRQKRSMNIVASFITIKFRLLFRF